MLLIQLLEALPIAQSPSLSLNGMEPRDCLHHQVKHHNCGLKTLHETKVFQLMKMDICPKKKIDLGLYF